jgi:hypothetical protein
MYIHLMVRVEVQNIHFKDLFYYSQHKLREGRINKGNFTEIFAVIMS